MNLFGKIKKRWIDFLHNQALKHKLYVIIFESDTTMGRLFDIILIGFIIASVAVVMLKSVKPIAAHYMPLLQLLEVIFSIFFTIEYVTRIYCSPQPKKYIFSFFGIVDLLSILPLYISFFSSNARYLMVMRAFRLIRVFRIFKLFNFLSEGNLLLRSLRLSAPKIVVFFFFVLILVTSIGTLMYMIEGTQPDTKFDNIPNSIYWAIVTMTTVGYGDITPTTALGRLLSAVVMLVGYTIIAVPTGIVSATMVGEHRKWQKIKCPSCGKSGHERGARFCRHCGKSLQNKTT